MASTSAPPQWTYDVFVSFRGEDIRKTFMDHLLKDFRQKGIHAFEDDKELPKGEKIPLELYKAIKESRFLIIIFSKNYASSSWCLRELTKILECKKMGDKKHELRVFFYDVKPDVVRKQTGIYEEAFAKHAILNSNEVVEWKEALYEAANISGLELKDTTNGYEAKFIDKISEDILEKLYCEPLHVADKLVGLNAYVNQLDLSRFIGSSKVHMIGICGISGIGKTTFARAIYNNMCTRFDECCFCEDVKGIAKQKGLTYVQMLLVEKIMGTTVVKILNASQGSMIIKKMMASKRIMLVLDDVDDHEQLEALAGSSNWFSPGSFIIFTSKDRQLLRSHDVVEIYDMKVLLHHEALELFSLYAFGKRHPEEDFKELACQVVKCLQGHPLALKVLGRCLYKKSKCVWESELDKLKAYPHMKIQERLRPSFDGLESDQQRIFLDIAFSLLGEKKDIAVSVLGSYTCSANADMEVLLDKSLITISEDDNLVQMHDLIQSMAWAIVDEEFEGKKIRSRLRNSYEICNVLSKSKATKAEKEAVEVLHLLLEEFHQEILLYTFEDMKNLRILKLFYREDRSFWKWKVTYSGRLKFLSNKLRLLHWHGFPFKSFPSDFYPEYIVGIDLSYSRIKKFWTTPKCFEKLKVMKLKHCLNLTRTPDFTKITNLEELNLEGCVKLLKVHPSFGMLKSLVVLNMRNCKSFKSFPCEVGLDSLETLDLSGCSKLDGLPRLSAKFPTLKEFHVDGATVMKHYAFLHSQCNLQVLTFFGPEGTLCRQWTSKSQPLYFLRKMQHPQSLVLPSLVGLRFLRRLHFVYCNMLEVPNSIGVLSCLEDLFFLRVNLTSLPGCLSQLSRLRLLALNGCMNLKVLPELPPGAFSLSAFDCPSLEGLLGLSNSPRRLVVLRFFNCPKLFRNTTIDSRSSILQPRTLNSYVPSLGSRNQLSYLLQHMNILSTIRGIFFAQERSFFRNTMDILFCGNRIPQWFTNQSMGNHVKIKLSSDWCYTKFRGYAICIVFKAKPRMVSDITPYFVVYNYDGVSLAKYNQFYPVLYQKDNSESDFVWFHFGMESSTWSEAKNFVTFSFGDSKGFTCEDDYSLRFEGNCYVVKECGVRLVCEDDVLDGTFFSITQDLPCPAQGSVTIRSVVDDEEMNLYW